MENEEKEREKPKMKPEASKSSVKGGRHGNDHNVLALQRS